MDLSQILISLASSFAVQIPYFLVIGFGFYISLSLKNKYPKTSKIAIIGLFLLLLKFILNILSSLFFSYMPILMRDSYQMAGIISMAINVIVNLILAIGLGFVFYAIGLERENN